MFNLAMKILKQAESKVLGFPSEPIFSSKIETKVHEYIKVPFYSWYYMKFGYRILFQSAFSWVYLTLVLFGFFLFIHFLSAKEGAIGTSILFFLSLIALPLILFSVPSRYTSSGIYSSVIEEIVTYSVSHGASNKDLTELVEQSVSLLKERCFARISTYKWLLAAIWAFTIFVINLQIDLIPLLTDNNLKNNLEFFNKQLVGYGIFSAFMLIPLMSVAAYNRAAVVLFNVIEYSLIEVKANYTEE